MGPDYVKRPSRHNLRQDFRAILIFAQHALDRVKLAGDLARADNRSAFFFLRMARAAFAHGLLLCRSGTVVKKCFAKHGGGGISLMGMSQALFATMAITGFVTPHFQQMGEL
jgi:hypothetical protein